MSVPTAISPVPTSQLLTAIASESAALAYELGLSSIKEASVKSAKSVTAVVEKSLNIKAFWGPSDIPDVFPVNWK